MPPTIETWLFSTVVPNPQQRSLYPSIRDEYCPPPRQDTSLLEIAHNLIVILYLAEMSALSTNALTSLDRVNARGRPNSRTITKNNIRLRTRHNSTEPPSLGNFSSRSTRTSSASTCIIRVMASNIPRPRASLTAGQGSSPSMKVPMGSRVVLSRKRNGIVRYVGKLVNESGEWYGVALDEPKGDNDGTRAKERYFSCPPNHGVFVRRKEIHCVKEPFNALKSPPSPITDESSSCNSSASNVSVDQQGETYSPSAAVHPVPRSTDNLTIPLMKTFKGFRKQLDFISLRTVGPGRSTEASPVASPASSSPSSPAAKSGLKPPSPLRRFASFSQGLPTPASVSSTGSPTSQPSSPSARRQSSIPLAPKPSHVRRVNSFRNDYSESSIQPVENASPRSPGRLSSFQGSFGYLVREDNDIVAYSVESDSPHTQLSLDAFVAGNTMIDDGKPSGGNTKDTTDKHVLTAPSIGVTGGDSPSKTAESTPLSSARSDSFLVRPSAAAEGSTGETLLNAPASTFPELSHAVVSSVSQIYGFQATEITSMPTLVDRTSTFRVPSIDSSALTNNGDGYESKDNPTSSPRESSTEHHRYSASSGPTQDAESSPAATAERTTSFRMRARASSFRIPTIDASSPASSPESSPSRRVNSFAELSFDNVEALDDNSSDGHSSIVPSPRDDISEASAVSAPETRQTIMAIPRNPRSHQEHTEVESLSPIRQLSDSVVNAGERPLFFRRTNIGHSPMERRSSYSSFSTSSSSPPRSPTTGGVHNVGSSRSSRVAELEKEISAMRSSHENIVAVLRATNKQHAANVLELRAQVAALTEGNLWLERQLTAKGELVRELRDLEQHHQRDSVSVSEVEKILEIKDTQIQTLEREMAQLRHRLTRLEADKDSQLYQQFQHFEARRARDEKRINELRKEVLAMCNERLELQSEVRDLKEMSLRFF